jgi:branched-chain amino acid transport system substrate-binding protein
LGIGSRDRYNNLGFVKFIKRREAMMVRKVFVIGAIVMFCLSVMGVTHAKEPVKVGWLGALTGPGAPFGMNMLQGVKMGVEEVNARGGVLGRKLEIVSIDDAADPAQSVSAMTKLVYQDKVDVVCGGWGSATILANMRVCEKAGVPYIAIGGSNPKITSKDNKWTFRPLQNDAKQGLEIADIAVKQLGYKRFGIIHDRNDYGTGAKDVFVQGLSKHNLIPVAVESYQMGDKDFTSQLIKIREAKPDVLAVLGTVIEGAAIAIQRTQLGMGNLRIVGVAGLANMHYIKLAGKATEGTVCLTYFNRRLSPESETWARNYEEKYKDSSAVPTPDVAWMGYSSIVNILEPALKMAGSTNKTKIRDALRKVKWRDLGQNINNYFDETGQAIRESIIIEVKNGDFVPYK